MYHQSRAPTGNTIFFAGIPRVTLSQSQSALTQQEKKIKKWQEIDGDMEIQSARFLNIFPPRPEPEPGKAEGQSRRLAHVAHTCGEKKAEAQESRQAPRGSLLLFQRQRGCQLPGQEVLRARRQIIKPDSVAIKKQFRSGFMEGGSPVMLI